MASIYRLAQRHWRYATGEVVNLQSDHQLGYLLDSDQNIGVLWGLAAKMMSSLPPKLGKSDDWITKNT